MCGVLADKAKAMSPYLRVSPGESASAVYKGFKMIDDKFNPGKEIFRFILEVDGKEKYFDSGKMAIAFILDKANDGDIVEFTNSGTSEKGVYSVKILVGQNMEADPDKKPKK